LWEDLLTFGIAGGVYGQDLDQQISSASDLPGGIAWQNVSHGTLTTQQVAALQEQGAGQVQQVYDNAVQYYGADSPAAEAAADILPTQIQGVYADIAALNPTSNDPLLNATGFAWYWWAAAAATFYLLTR
jgi:hypothetical protein